MEWQNLNVNLSNHFRNKIPESHIMAQCMLLRYSLYKYYTGSEIYLNVSFTEITDCYKHVQLRPQHVNKESCIQTCI